MAGSMRVNFVRDLPGYSRYRLIGSDEESKSFLRREATSTDYFVVRTSDMMMTAAGSLSA